MLRLLLAAPLALIALPAVAQNAPAPGPLAVSTALAKGCTVQQVHTPAGKLVHNSPIVKCDSAKPILADKQPNEPQAIVMK
jgi:hypothetical protein